VLVRRHSVFIVAALCVLTVRLACAYHLHVGEFGESMDDDASDSNGPGNLSEKDADVQQQEIDEEADIGANGNLTGAQIQNLANKCKELGANALGDVGAGDLGEAAMGQQLRVFLGELGESFQSTGGLKYNCTNYVKALHLKKKLQNSEDSIETMEAELRKLERFGEEVPEEGNGTESNITDGSEGVNSTESSDDTIPPHPEGNSNVSDESGVDDKGNPDNSTRKDDANDPGSMNGNVSDSLSGLVQEEDKRENKVEKAEEEKEEAGDEKATPDPKTTEAVRHTNSKVPASDEDKEVEQAKATPEPTADETSDDTNDAEDENAKEETPAGSEDRPEGSTDDQATDSGDNMMQDSDDDELADEDALGGYDDDTDPYPYPNDEDE